MRTRFLFFLLLLACEKLSAGFGIELDVVFRDSAFRCRLLHVIDVQQPGRNDTLATFDTLDFSSRHRTSLFYTVAAAGENKVVLTDARGLRMESAPFKVSPLRTTFAVSVEPQHVKTASRDFLYPQRNEDGRSYYFFLAIFFAVKLLITSIFVFPARLPKRLISIASGIFLISSFIDWVWPFQYFYRLLAVTAFEFLLFALTGGKSISWWRAALWAVTVNAVGYGIILAAYLIFVFR